MYIRSISLRADDRRRLRTDDHVMGRPDSENLSKPEGGGLDAREAIRLLMAHRGSLFGYVTAITGDPLLAEDVFQEVSVLVLEKHHEVYGPEAFPAWIRSLARYRALDQVRKRKRNPISLSADVIESLDSDWDDLDRNEDSDRIAALKRCLERLTPRSRRLVELRYEENRNGKQIAETVRRPLNTVYVALSRIHGNLAECVRRRLGLKEVNG